MNKLFSDWHRETSIDLAGIDIQLREQAANHIAENADAANVIFWVELGFGQAVDSEDVQSLAVAFREYESTFRLRNNDAEMRMLACALLDQTCRRDDTLGTLASYATLVADGNGWEPLILDVIEAAQAHVERQGESVRSIPKQPLFRTIPPLIDAASRKTIDEQIATQSYVHGSLFKAVFDQFAETTGQALKSLQLSARQSREQSVLTASILSEQTNVINWLLNGSSARLGIPWTSLDERTRATYAGVELADSLSLMLEPPRALSLLATHLGAALADSKASGRPKKSATHDFTWSDNSTLANLVSASIPSDASSVTIAALTLRRMILLQAWETANE